MFRSGEGFVYVSEWCICYSACITFGSMGRILAMVSEQYKIYDLLSSPQPPHQRAAVKRQYISDKVHVE